MKGTTWDLGFLATAHEVDPRSVLLVSLLINGGSRRISAGNPLRTVVHDSRIAELVRDRLVTAAPNHVELLAAAYEQWESGGFRTKEPGGLVYYLTEAGEAEAWKALSNVCAQKVLGITYQYALAKAGLRA